MQIYIDQQKATWFESNFKLNHTESCSRILYEQTPVAILHEYYFATASEILGNNGPFSRTVMTHFNGHQNH